MAVKNLKKKNIHIYSARWIYIYMKLLRFVGKICGADIYI